MRDVVFIFGAGASADCGLPTQTNFRRKVRELSCQRDVPNAVADDFRQVISWLAKPSQIGCPKDARANLEEMFSLLYTQSEIGRPGAADNLKTLENVIAYTYEMACCWPTHSPLRRSTQADRGYAKLIRTLRTHYRDRWLGDGECPFSFVTFNYDLALEDAWTSELQQPEMKSIKKACYSQLLKAELISLPDEHAEEIADVFERLNVSRLLPLARYGLLNRDDYPKLQPLILKPHGSVNWGICPDCGNVQVMRVHLDRQQPGPRVYGMDRHSHCKWHPETSYENHPSLPQFRYRPLLVPPTWNKGGQCAELRNIWRQVAEEVASARTLVFVGYSLPPTDTHVQYLLRTALARRLEAQRIMVVNLHVKEDNTASSKQQTQSRYEGTLGISFDNHNYYLDKAFAEAVDDIRSFIHRQPEDLIPPPAPSPPS